MTNHHNPQIDLAWLTQRLGYGMSPDEQTNLDGVDPTTVLARRLDPESHGVAIPPSPFEGLGDLIPPDIDPDNFPALRRAAYQQLLGIWLDELRDTSDPLLEWMTFFWHDHFAVTSEVVLNPVIMVNHLSLLRQHARGNFGDLLRAVTLDPAMLIFLDGRSSVARQPNENYGRELLELYSIGVEHYTEADVVAAASALTGWQIQPGDGGTAVFSARRHDDTHRTLLGASGVHDVDTVLDAVLNHQALPGFIAGKLAASILGNDFDENQVPEFAHVFANHNLDLAPLISAIAEAGLALTSRSPLVRHPVSWLTNAEKTTGARIDTRARAHILHSMGMVPGRPPHVGGFPPPENYLNASSTAARFTSAGLVANQAPEDSLALAAASTGDWQTLASLLGRPQGFSAASLSALDGLKDATPSGQQGRNCLALSLSTPDFLVI